MTEPAAPLLEMLHISKRFPGIQALDDVSLELGIGECLGIIGENGAGKSTLIKILGGVYHPTSGEIRIDGRPVAIQSPPDATDLGVQVIHQELNLCDNLDVASNVFLGREHLIGGPLKILNRPGMRRAAGELCDRVGLAVPPYTAVASLSTALRQQVEIAKALAVQARILVMDEPTSSLSQSETERLFGIVGRLKADGVSIVYISHRMPEILALTDRVLCLRDGVAVGRLRTSQATHESLVRMMVGRTIDKIFVKENKPTDEVALDVSSFRIPGSPYTYDFDVRRGEVFGLAGLVGAGRTELVEAIFGLKTPQGGKVRVEGRPVPPGSVREAIRHGMSLVPEDRRRHGLIVQLTVAENLALGRQGRDGPLRVKSVRDVLEQAAEQIESMRIKTPSPRTSAMNLSGGNQQKVVLGKWLSLVPKVLILDEPTRGIDVGSKQEIYTLISRLANAGLAIVMVSSEMEEIIGLADRVLVMHERRPAGILTRDEMSEEKIMKLASGLEA